jgi:hypothetical protein
MSDNLPRETEERVATYLLRSRNSGLAIRLVFRPRGRGSTQLKNMIYPHLSRCHRVEFEFDFYRQASQWFPLPGSLHRLTILHCLVHHISPNITPLGLFSETDNGPRLQDMALVLRGMPTHSLILGSINVELLTEVRLVGMYFTWRDTITFLSQCHSIRKLNLAVRPRRLEEPFPPFTLPELYCLQAYGLEFAMVIRTPNLQSLTIFEALDGGLPHDIPPMPPTLCFPSLRALRFLEVDVTRPEIETFLQSNPTIEVLQFWGCARAVEDSDSEEFDQVSDAGGAMSEEADNAFLPSLKLIETSDCGRLDCYGSVIEWLFNSRPELRFEGGEDGTWDGDRVSPDLAALIYKFPADYFYS